MGNPFFVWFLYSGCFCANSVPYLLSQMIDEDSESRKNRDRGVMRAVKDQTESLLTTLRPLIKLHNISQQ
jgi:hypothetical protein